MKDNKYTVTFEFDNKEYMKHFLGWMCDGGGEQQADYAFFNRDGKCLGASHFDYWSGTKKKNSRSIPVTTCFFDPNDPDDKEELKDTRPETYEISVFRTGTSTLYFNSKGSMDELTAGYVGTFKVSKKFMEKLGKSQFNREVFDDSVNQLLRSLIYGRMGRGKKVFKLVNPFQLYVDRLEKEANLKFQGGK